MKWEKIENAPKNGTDILAWDEIGKFYQVVYWEDENLPDMHWATIDGPDYHDDRFTHWMRLPDPPKEK